MKINNYEIRDPTGLDETNNPLYEKFDVPFGESIIFDMGTVDGEISFDLVLTNDQIKDITNMINISRVIFIEGFKDFNGFFYVTKFDLAWDKCMTNHKIVTYSLDGFYLGKHPYLKLNYFNNVQKTDYIIEEPALVCIPESYISKATLTSDYERTNGTNGHILVYKDPTGDLKFKATNTLFINGLTRYYIDDTQVYGDESITNNIIVDNNVFKTKAVIDDVNVLFGVYDSSDNLYCNISDGLNHLHDSDITLDMHPFNPTLMLNHSKIQFFSCQNYIELLKSPSTLRFTQKRFAITTGNLGSYGDKVRTTLNPQTFILDRSIGGVLPTTLQYAESPGFIHYDVGDTRTFCSFTNIMNTHPNDGFNPNTFRNYLLFLNKTIGYSNNSEWTLSALNWTSMVDGADFEGVASYVQSDVAGAYIEVIKNLPYTGSYDVYVMARNCADSNMTFKLYLNTVDKGLVTFDHASDAHNAHFVFLGNYDLNSGNNTFKITRESGTLGLFYLLIVPTAIDNDDCMYSNVCSALNDSRSSYEVL